MTEETLHTFKVWDSEGWLREDDAKDIEAPDARTAASRYLCWMEDDITENHSYDEWDEVRFTIHVRGPNGKETIGAYISVEYNPYISASLTREPRAAAS